MWQNHYLPPYRFPDWMTSETHNLLHRDSDAYNLIMTHYNQQQFQHGMAVRWNGNPVATQVPPARGAVRAISNPPLPPHRLMENQRDLRRLGNGQQNLRVTVNPSSSQPEKRKHADRDDGDRYGSGVKRVRSDDRPSTVQREHARTAAADDDNDECSSDDEEEVSDERTQAERLSREMLEYMDLHVQKQPDYQAKEELRARLESDIREIYQRTNLVLVGSSMNGFGRCGSDADFCLVLTLREIDQRFDARHILDQLHSFLKHRCSYICKSFVIYAKVPILRFTDRFTGIECDININNMTGIRNTHLLQCYSKVDRRVVPMVMWLKHWFKSNGINDASQGTLSSYAIVLLVFYYLQEVCSPPVIPRLQEQYPHIFSVNKDIHSIHRSINSHQGEPEIRFRSKNTQNLGELIKGFFKHSTSFNYTMMVMSLRLGKSFKLPNNWRQQYIHIEEPIERQNVARAVHKGFQYQKILAKLKEADQVLSSDLNCSLDDLLSSHQPQGSGVTKKKTKRQRIKDALRFIRRKEKSKQATSVATATANTDQHTRFNGTGSGGTKNNGKKKKQSR